MGSRRLSAWAMARPTRWLSRQNRRCCEGLFGNLFTCSYLKY
jgi:hypothetical protein